MQQGMIFDAALIAVPSSTKNKQGKRDPKMHQTCKCKQVALWDEDQYRRRECYRLDPLLRRHFSQRAMTSPQKRSRGEEWVAYADSTYQSIEQRAEMKDMTFNFRVAMRPGKLWLFPDMPEGQLNDLVETAKAHIFAKGEYPFRLIKQQFGLQKIRLCGIRKNRCKVCVLAALTTIFLARRQLLLTS